MVQWSGDGTQASIAVDAPRSVKARNSAISRAKLAAKSSTAAYTSPP